MLTAGRAARRATAWSIAPLVASMACVAAEPTPSNDESATVVFAADIDADSVDAFIAMVGPRPLRRIVVTSDGGDILAGIRLGNWIVDRGLDVEVRDVCASSCAKDLFTAGRQRIIDDGGIVLWHGSALQANFRAILAECPQRIRELASLRDTVIDRYQWALGEARKSCEYLSKATERQAAFFARTGVDEAITRLGQEPRNFRAIWTVSAATMARFGMVAVQAPSGYASHEYLKHFNAADDPAPILALGFDADGDVIEEAR